MRQHGARIRRANWTLLPTLMQIEGELSSYHQGQHKQCSLHGGSRLSALLRAAFLLLHKPLAPWPQPISPPRSSTGLSVAMHLTQVVLSALCVFTMGSPSYSESRAPGELVVVSFPKTKWS